MARKLNNRQSEKEEKMIFAQNHIIIEMKIRQNVFFFHLDFLFRFSRMSQMTVGYIIFTDHRLFIN